MGKRHRPDTLDLSSVGGVSEMTYLRKKLDKVLFPEIWKLRTDL
jgi:tryptophan 2,3-dioxygenase